MQVSSQLETSQHSEGKEVYNRFWAEMQSIGNKHPKNLTELRRGEAGIIERLELPEDEARRLMEMGFLPGHSVTPAHAAPGGDPRVFRVDGSEVALRRETARHLILRSPASVHKAVRKKK